MLTRRGLLTGVAALAAAWTLPDWEPRKKVWALGGLPPRDRGWLFFADNGVWWVTGPNVAELISRDPTRWVPAPVGFAGF
jgi:hypothetical protein